MILGFLQQSGVGVVKSFEEKQWDENRVGYVAIEIPLSRSDGTVYNHFHTVELRGRLMDTVYPKLREGCVVYFEGIPKTRAYIKNTDGSAGYSNSTVGLLRIVDDLVF